MHKTENVVDLNKNKFRFSEEAFAGLDGLEKTVDADRTRVPCNRSISISSMGAINSIQHPASVTVRQNGDG